MSTYGTTRVGDVITAWSTDLRRSLEKVARLNLKAGETLTPYPCTHDAPGKPSRFIAQREEGDDTSDDSAG